MNSNFWKRRSWLFVVLFSLSLCACAIGGGDLGTGMQGGGDVGTGVYGGGDEGTGLPATGPIRSYEGALISLLALQIYDIRPPQWLRGNWKLTQTQATEITAQFRDSSISFNNGFAALRFGKDNANIEVTQHDDTSFAWKIGYQSNGQPLTISYGCTRVDDNDLVCSYATVDNVQVHFKMTRF